MKVMRLFAPSLAALVLVACSKIPDIDQRYGPGPDLPVADVKQRLDNQRAVMDLLDERAAEWRTPGAGRWYDAALLGFNYVDEECAAYLRLNFRLTRMRDRDVDMLQTLSNSSAGFLKAAAVADPTITTVAAAFGLAANLTKAQLGSYLFSMEPNVVFRTVTKLQNTYRARFAAQKADVATPANAYRAIQNYYTLCFPQTIEAKMSEFISSAVGDDASKSDKGGDVANAAATAGATIDPTLTSKPR